MAHSIKRQDRRNAMTRRLATHAAVLMALSATGACLGTPTDARAAAAADPFTGRWAAMGISPVVIAAPDSHHQIQITLPDELHAITRHQFTLTRHDHTTLQSINRDPLVTFRMVSENSADLTIKGNKPGQMLDLPLSRDD
ncbi:putative exported protein [Gluconacetobacter diazotrophicus PA1 5]|uniref:Putative exported protein n=2 Tax=Gluconacetobacter diazotrophicus TaxID=33996 RepID=A9HAK6_GLUDA|nr:putative exported protein [Gluconacetobacter diazotrophicus PA1 5]